MNISRERMLERMDRIKPGRATARADFKKIGAGKLTIESEPDEIIQVGSGYCMKYIDWLIAETKRIHGSSIKERQVRGKKVVWLQGEVWGLKMEVRV